MQISRQAINALILIAVVWGFDITGSSRLTAQESDLPQPIKRALGRIGTLKTFTVTWTQQNYWGEAEGWSNPTLHYLVWQDGKMYDRSQEGRAWTDAPKSERAFDGHIFFSGWRDQRFSNGKPKNPAIIISLAKNEPPDADYFDVRKFQSAGIHLPCGVSEWFRIKQLQSQLLFALEHGGELRTQGPAHIDGRPMTRITLLTDNPVWNLFQRADLTREEKMLRDYSPGITEEQIQQKLALYKRARELAPRKVEYVFYLDPEHGYAVRRWQELTEDGKLQRQADCTDPIKLPHHEIWLPRKWRIDSYIEPVSFPGEVFQTPLRKEVVEVSELDTKPVSNESFTLKYTTPGTEVTDKTLPEAKLAPGADIGVGGVAYKVPARPEDLDSAIEEARALTRTRAEVEGRRESIRWIMLLASTVVLAGVLGYVIIRYRRKVARS